MKSPKIRFKEFNSEWNSATLGEFGEIIKGQQINKIDLLPSGKYYVLNGGITPSGYTNSFNTNENIISISEGGNSCGFVNFNKEKFWSGGHNYTLQNLVINTRFLYALLKYREKNIMSLRVGSGLPNIQKSSLLEFKIQIPTDLKEQEAIGEFFKKIDEILDLEKLRFKKFENFKKTMLDKLFVASGENTPRLRLGSFTSAWTSVNLGEVCEIFRGLTYSPNDIAKQGVKVLRSSNIKNSKFIENNDDVFVKEKAVNIKKIQDLDILITSANGSTNLVGKHAIITKAKNMVHGGFMLLLRAKNPYFINALMDTSWYNNFISLNVHGGNGAIGNLKANDLLNAKIQIPTDLKEQEAIGEFFKKIDEILELSQNRISKLENIKKYLLNKMFV